MVPGLDQSAWELAKGNAAGVYRSAAFGLAAAGVSVLTSAAAAWLSSGESPERIAATLIVAGLAGIFACLAVVLAFQVATAPFRQRNELRQAWGATSRLSRGQVAVKLTDLARAGDDLLCNCKADGYTSQDELAVDSWTEEVVAFLVEWCDADLGKKFALASRGTWPLVGRLEKRIAALDEIAGALEGGAPGG